MTAFWVLAPIMVLAALGILFVRKAVHAALLLAVVMIGLAILYLVQDAPFLFAVQIIVTASIRALWTALRMTSMPSAAMTAMGARNQNATVSPVLTTCSFTCWANSAALIAPPASARPGWCQPNR